MGNVKESWFCRISSLKRNRGCQKMHVGASFEMNQRSWNQIKDWISLPTDFMCTKGFSPWSEARRCGWKTDPLRVIQTTESTGNPANVRDKDSSNGNGKYCVYLCFTYSSLSACCWRQATGWDASLLYHALYVIGHKYHMCMILPIISHQLFYH